jgi:hypothetical protein
MLVLTSFAQTPFKGMYVNGFADILGYTEQEDSLLEYAESNGFTALSLYNLHSIDLTETITVESLAAFLRKARVDHALTEIGAIGENANGFRNRILPYNLSRTDTNERFNVFNLEFEFWVSSSIDNYYCADYLLPGGYTCDEAGAFSFFMRQLEVMDSITALYGWKSEIYLGHFDESQATAMAEIADRILLSNYNSDPYNAFPYSEARLERLGNSGFEVSVAGLFSAEPDYLQPWLLSHNNDLDAVFAIYASDYEEATGTWKDHIQLVGQQWFTYSDLPYQLGTVGLPITDPDAGFTIYPNPATTYIEVHGFLQLTPVLTDVNGKQISTDFEQILTNHLQLNLSVLSPGIYFLQLDAFRVKIIHQ